MWGVDASRIGDRESKNKKKIFVNEIETESNQSPIDEIKKISVDETESNRSPIGSDRSDEISEVDAPASLSPLEHRQQCGELMQVESGIGNRT